MSAGAGGVKPWWPSGRGEAQANCGIIWLNDLFEGSAAERRGIHGTHLASRPSPTRDRPRLGGYSSRALDGRPFVSRANGQQRPTPSLPHARRRLHGRQPGQPGPHTLKGEALVKARLTPETWRLEVVAEGKAEVAKPLRQADGTAIDLAALLKLGETKGVLFLKAMQCNNIAQPLGQGLWEGVPLRDVLRLAGKMKDVRRVYYWGFHNDDPKQMFRSSLAINQVLDTPPGELPPFVAYRLNGGPIPLERGGPVRMVVPWAHGFKSVKWLQQIMLTNDYQANDTYALANNDPESYLKTAAYLDDPEEAAYPAGKPVVIRGTAMVGWPGLDRVEYWLRPVSRPRDELRDDDPAWATARVAALPPRPAARRPGRGAARRRESCPDLGLRAGRQAEGMADAIQHRPLVGDARGLEAGRLTNSAPGRSTGTVSRSPSRGPSRNGPE